MADRGGHAPSPDPVGERYLTRLEPGTTDWGDLVRALEHVEFGLVVWKDGCVRVANKAAAELVGVPLEKLIGRDLREFLGPEKDVGHAVEGLAGGVFHSFLTRRAVRRADGTEVAVWVTTRVVDVGGNRLGLTVWAREDELGSLGRHPVRAWADIVPVAVGETDRHWRIECVSAEIYVLLGHFPHSVIGSSLVDWAEPADAEVLRRVAAQPIAPAIVLQIRLRAVDGTWKRICVLAAAAPAPPPDLVFALVGQVDDYLPTADDRSAELEMRLRRIGAEVRAAGFLHVLDSLPSADLPELGLLTSRQWEIANRIAQGQRVPTIARDLYISQSTVRNHLAAIFQKFGVHSQAELVERLRSKEHEDGRHASARPQPRGEQRG